MHTMHTPDIPLAPDWQEVKWLRSVGMEQPKFKMLNKI